MIQKTFLLSCLTAAGLLAATPAAHSAPFAGNGLVIECPPLAKILCGMSSSPVDLGEPTATSSCPGSITITYADQIIPGGACPADRFDHLILRTWTATDACGNVASCTQTVDVVRQIWSLDIKPTSCPNPINVGSNGNNAAVSIAILGTATQDVTQIDPASIQIWREGCLLGPVTPQDASYQDVAAPWVYGDPCGCTTAGPDGRMDLRLKFSRLQLVQGLGLAAFKKQAYVRLVVTARTWDGCGIVAGDCVRIQ